MLAINIGYLVCLILCFIGCSTYGLDVNNTILNKNGTVLSTNSSEKATKGVPTVPSPQIIPVTLDHNGKIKGSVPTPNTLKPDPDPDDTTVSSVTPNPHTSEIPQPTNASTVTPDSNVTTPSIPTSTSKTPNVTTLHPPITPDSNSTTTHLPSTAPPIPHQRQFDGPSFIGGIILTTGLMAISFVAFKFYKARTERNYHTL